MIPVRLELKNFLPYHAPDPIRFDGVHLACLTGPNGAGKSSLLDAMTWALWGRARAKRDDDLLHLGQQDMYVQLDFEQEGVVYRVLRRRARRRTGSLELFVMTDEGKMTVITEPSMRATQDKIDILLRLDYETFIHSAFLQQGKADAFTTRTPAERKRILSDILGLERWAQYEDAAKKHIRTLDNEMEVIDIRLREISADLAKEPQLKKDLSDAQSAHSEAQTALAAAEEELAEVAHAPAELKHAQEQQAMQERRIRENERDFASAEDDSKRQTERIANYEDIIARREEIEQGYDALQAARDADQSLGEKLTALKDVDEAIHDLQRQLDAARAELEQDKRERETLIIELERTQEQDFDADLDEVNGEIAQLEVIEGQRNGLQDALNELGETRAALETTQRALTAEGQNIGKRIEQLGATDDPICPLCGQPLDEDHRTKIIAELTTKREQKREEYRLNHNRLTEIAEEVKDYREQSGKMEVTLKTLPALRQRAGALQVQAQAAADAESRLYKAHAELTEITTALESDDFARDIRDQLTALEAQRGELGYDRTTHDAAREQLTTYRGYETEKTRLDVALESLPDAEKALENAEQRKARIAKALEEDTAALETLLKEIAQLEVLVQEQQKRQQEVNRQRTNERVAYNRVVTSQQELKALDQQRKRKAELNERRQTMQYEKAIYTELRDAFGKNGVPAMIIESAIPELEVTANDLLTRMTDGRMHLRFSTQREKVSGGMTETLDIEIADELGTRGYELYSGGEAFRINFAIRVALSKMLARRAGAHLRTLFIDEGFGTQDADGRDRLVEAINVIQDDFDLVLVITHIDELRDSFPVHIVVDKTSSGSMVSVR